MRLSRHRAPVVKIRGLLRHACGPLWISPYASLLSNEASRKTLSSRRETLKISPGRHSWCLVTIADLILVNHENKLHPPCQNLNHPLICPQLRKRYKFRISGSTIRSNIVLRKIPLGVYSSCFIEAHPITLHDLPNLLLALLIKTGAGVS